MLSIKSGGIVVDLIYISNPNNIKITINMALKGSTVIKYKIGPMVKSEVSMAFFLVHRSDSQPPNRLPIIPPPILSS